METIYGARVSSYAKEQVAKRNKTERMLNHARLVKVLEEIPAGMASDVIIKALEAAYGVESARIVRACISGPDRKG